MSNSSGKDLKTYEEAVERIENFRIDTFVAVVTRLGMRVEIVVAPENLKKHCFEFEFHRHKIDERTVEVRVLLERVEQLSVKNPNDHKKTTIEYVVDLINRLFIEKALHVENLGFQFMTETSYLKAENDKMEKRMEDFMTKLIEKLNEGTKKIYAKTLKIGQGQGKNQDVLRILQFLHSGFLESIEIPNFVNVPVTKYGRICNEDAWKEAKNLKIGTKPGNEIDFPQDFFHDFETFSISLPPFYMVSLCMLVNFLVKKESFKEATIETKGAKKAFDDNGFRMTGQSGYFTRTYTYDLPLNTAPVLEAKVTSDKVIITRKTKPDELSPQTSSEGSNAQLLRE